MTEFEDLVFEHTTQPPFGCCSFAGIMFLIAETTNVFRRASNVPEEDQSAACSDKLIS